MKRGDKVAVAFLAFIITAVFGDVLFAGRNFYFRDLTRFYYPIKKLLSRIILSGEFPWWNPAIAAGQPLAANPEYEVFYPPQWLILLPDYDLGYRLHILAHFYIAGIGMYALLRRMNLTIRSAMFGAIAFTFGGLLLSSVNLLPILFCLAWLPWILLVVDMRRFGALALLAALPMLAGEPVTIAQICLIACAYALYRRVLIKTAAALVVAGLIAAVQLLPAVDHLRDSVRVRGFTFAVVSTWSTPPVKIAELFLPGVMGPVGDHARLYWGTAKYGWLDPFYLSIYFGLIAIAFAVSGLVLRLPGWWAAAAATFFSLLLAFGKHTPVLRLLYDTSLFSSFRYPEKFLTIGVFALTVFSAIAFDRAIGGDRRVLRGAFMVALTTAAVSLVLLAAMRFPDYPTLFVRFWDISVHPLVPLMLRASIATWVACFVRAAVVAVVLWLMMRDIRWSFAAIAILTLDLAHQRLSVAETIEGEFFRTRPAIAAQTRPGDRLFHQADWYGSALIARQYFDLPGMYYVIRNGVFPLTGAAWGISYVLNPDIDQTFLAHSAELNAAMVELRNRGVPRWWEPLMAMSAATRRAMYLPFDATKLQPIILVPENSNPKFYFADQVVPANSRKEFVDALARGVSRRAALVSGGQAPPPVRTGEGACPPLACAVLSVSETSNTATIEVESSGDALLICSITRHKYWRATIDGNPTTTLPVNIAYQAVRVPKGRHQVRLEYRNPLIIVGGTISLVALAAVLAAIISRRRETSRRADGADSSL